jgi:hypothetical protein
MAFPPVHFDYFILAAGYRLTPALSLTRPILGGLRGLANARGAPKHSRPGLFCIALICFNEAVWKNHHADFMKISDTACPSCLACYEVAEAVTVAGHPGEVRCTVCGAVLASWREPRLRAYRLVMPIEHKYWRSPDVLPPPHI